MCRGCLETFRVNDCKGPRARARHKYFDCIVSIQKCFKGCFETLWACWFEKVMLNDCMELREILVQSREFGTRIATGGVSGAQASIEREQRR